MDGALGVVIHVLIETTPGLGLACYFCLCEHSFGFWSQALLICVSLLWYYLSIVLLHWVGLTSAIFQMEYLVGPERALSLSPRGQLQLLLVQMESPADLEHFGKKLKGHL